MKKFLDMLLALFKKNADVGSEMDVSSGDTSRDFKVATLIEIKKKSGTDGGSNVPITPAKKSFSRCPKVESKTLRP